MGRDGAAGRYNPGRKDDSRRATARLGQDSAGLRPARSELEPDQNTGTRQEVRVRVLGTGHQSVARGDQHTSSDSDGSGRHSQERTGARPQLPARHGVLDSPGTRQAAGTGGRSAAQAGARSRHGARAERGQRPERMERAAQGRRRARSSEPAARDISQSVQSVEDQRRPRRQPLVTGLPGHDTDRFSRHERGAAGRTGIRYNPKPGSSCKVEDWLDFRRPQDLCFVLLR